MPKNRRKRIWKVYKINFPDKPQNYIGITSRTIDARVLEHGQNKIAKSNFFTHKWLRQGEDYFASALWVGLTKPQALKHEQLEIQKLIKANQPVLNRTIRKIDEQNYHWHWCTWHGRQFPRHFFNIDRRRTSGRCSRCKKCVGLVNSLLKSQPPSQKDEKNTIHLLCQNLQN